MADHPQFEIGREYRRKPDIHEKYGGQRQGGISTPKDVPSVFLFTSNAGEQHGYKDEYRPDGLFWYTGEGQLADMKMEGGNKAILTHVESKKSLHVFEYTRKAHVRYLGKAECLGYHEEVRPNREGDDRIVFVFHLDIDSFPMGNEVSEPQGVSDKPELSKLQNKSLFQLREAALKKPSGAATKREKTELAYFRSQALRLYVVGRSLGVCEGCRKPAPFRTASGPYLECHHLHRLADGGPDHPQNVVAVCPNCHRRSHYAEDAKAFNEQLIQVAATAEENQFCNPLQRDVVASCEAAPKRGR